MGTRSRIVALVAVLVTAFTVPTFGQESVAKKVRETYPAGRLSDPQKVLLLSDVARALGPGWGVLANKGHRSGRVCKVPGDPTEYRCDHVCRFDGSIHVDVLADEETSARPSWKANGPVPSSRVCVVPLGGAAPTPDPDPPQPPAECNLTPLQEQIDQLRGEVKAYGDLTLDALQQARDQQAAHIAKSDTHDQSEAEHREKVQSIWKRWETYGLTALGIFLGKVGLGQ